MKEAFVHKDLAVTIEDTNVPVPGAGQVLIRVIVSGTNPKDWKMPPHWPADGTPFNQGDDLAGYIEAVGDGVVGFRKGDKVAAFHPVMQPHGSYAEYAIAPDSSTFHVPEETSFEEAATIPLAAITAALGLYQRMKLPLPWNPTSEPLPLVIYGGATAVGAFAIKFAQLSNIHPLITVAGKGIPFVKTLLDPAKGDIVIDYREGHDAVRAQIKAAAGGRLIHYAFDAVSEHGSLQNIGAALTGPGEMAIMLPSGDFQPPEGISIGQAIAGSVHFPPAAGKTIEHTEFGAAFFQLIGRGLAQGWFSGHRYEVRPGGLAGIEGALQDLKDGKASAVKYVVRIGETEGVSQ
ncbi:GroES-like protein [Aspergillus cavernicola]|uniref:GroES-like protein n=1 Tax=Aspergillus cavernicola TaxID=176166 RepID=A0ABR4IWN9_9EURO